MTNTEFLITIQQALHTIALDFHLKNKLQFFQDEITKILILNTNPQQQMTNATILFEGFYRHLDENPLKTILAHIRKQRWQKHYGVPTIGFLHSFKQSIDNIQQIFINNLPALSSYPWFDIKYDNVPFDTTNHTYINLSSFANVKLPLPEEISSFTKTHNPFGGFAIPPCDPISQQFIQHTKEIARQQGRVLEIGAAFGSATLAATSPGAIVYCNDIDSDNLTVVRQRYLMRHPEAVLQITGDIEQLIFIPGAFPEELTELPENFFDAILICRLLHFFTGEQIEKSLQFLATRLSPSGKIYIICETPYLKNWMRFIPVMQARIDANQEWPGEINNPAEFESSGRASALPKFVH